MDHQARRTSPVPEQRVDSLVRAFLQEQERTVDAERILAGVRAKNATTPEAPKTRRPPRIPTASARWSMGVAAACLVMIFAWNQHRASVRADAINLVRVAKAALEPRSDYMYRIQINLAHGVAERFPFLAALAPLDCRLWTRADRFWIEARRADWTWACGRDERGQPWIAPNRETGLFFVTEEAPMPLALALELCSLDLETVLDLLLTDFDSNIVDDDTDASAGITRIRGTLKPSRPPRRFRSVEVEIDNETKRVRRVVLARMHLGRAIAQVSFTFDQTASQPEQAYRLSGHLDPEHLTYGPDQPLRRRRELIRFFGSLLLGE